MTAPDVFEYALVRVVPRVERGEAINVGVIVYSQAFRYLCARIELDEPRLLAVDPAADLDAVRAGYGFPSAFAHPFLTGFLLALLYVGLAHWALAAAVGRARRTGLLLKLSE